MKVIIDVLKFTVLPIILFVSFNLFEYGLVWDKIDKYLHPAILVAISMGNFFIPKTRKFSFGIAVSLLASMVVIYLLGNLNLANIVGSFGFTLLLIVILSLFPQLVKNGYVKKI